ncbi:alpha/beta hydrolase [Alkalihalobacillus sp. CinArs1]|uniref:alpha/beta hydrolase n=1 Tax=Alkalihalobacillus sp. CinArs1 TaxID=2995314 RepID=UPI0022DE6A7F|nr:alpha/beta fold hydrolase [Alkalihalobacillus sp. CinArs1]
MVGCMLIHGFTGAPYEVEPLADYLREHTDWKISVPTLPGHGEYETLHGVSFQEWIDTAEEKLKELLETCDTVYLVGFSMGGVLAGYLATAYKVEKLVLLSAAYRYIHPVQMVKDIGRMVLDTSRGQISQNELYIRYKEKLKVTPFQASLQFRKLVQKLRPSFRDVKVPTLILQGKLDSMVPYKTAHTIYQTIGSKQKQFHVMDCSRHLICHGDDRDDVIQKVYQFLTNGTDQSQHTLAPS